MAQAPLPDTDAKTEAAAKIEAQRARQRRRWEEEGYDPQGHLKGISGEGDEQTLRIYYSMESNIRRGTDGMLASYLAYRDIYEIAFELHQQRRRRAA